MFTVYFAPVAGLKRLLCLCVVVSYCLCFMLCLLLLCFPVLYGRFAPLCLYFEWFYAQFKWCSEASRGLFSKPSLSVRQ